jgi:hypothetical protein
MRAPKLQEDAERVTDITVGVVLDLMRQLFDFVVVDCGKHVDENAVAAWERSDELLYVVDHSLVSAHGGRRFNELFSRLGLRLEEPRFVLNKFDPHNVITEAALAHSMGVIFSPSCRATIGCSRKCNCVCKTCGRPDLIRRSRGPPRHSPAESTHGVSRRPQRVLAWWRGCLVRSAPASELRLSLREVSVGH